MVRRKNINNKEGPTIQKMPAKEKKKERQRGKASLLFAYEPHKHLYAQGAKC